MTTVKKKILFFIAAPSHNLKPIESFLKKRNFDVHIETEMVNAMGKIIELQPDFIFLAWDHPNPKVMNIPKLAAQASLANVVPYVMGYAKEETRKLNICNLSPKLYPPVSGPAIERLVLKFGKQEAQESLAYQDMLSKGKSEADRKNMKDMLIAGIENNAIETMSESAANKKNLESEQKAKYFRQESISKKNFILHKSQKSSMSSNTVNKLKNTFPEKIKQPLENILSALNESKVDSQTKRSSGHFSQQTEKVSDMVLVQSSDKSQNLNRSSTSASSDPSSRISNESGAESATNVPNQEISNSTDSAIRQNTSEPVKAYCISIYSEEWCGYLIISSNTELDFSTIDMIFTDWMKTQFNNLQEVDEYDFIELQNVTPGLIQQLKESAEYYESIKIDNYDIGISFFPIDPAKMQLELNEDKNLIKISTEDIPSETELDFSLHLHLPENKKYIVYTQVNKKLSAEQKNRLLNNKMTKLYTPLDFEKEFKKFITEKNVKDFCLNLAKKKNSV